MTDCGACEARLLSAMGATEIKAAVDFIIAEIVRQGNMFCEERSAALLKHLRDLRCFEETVRLARTFLEYGVQTSRVRTFLGQALIDLGNTTEAISVLSALASELNAELESPVLAEVYGSLGRSFKQLYIDARPSPVEPREYDLRRALKYYNDGYHLDTAANHWHLINVAALYAHASRVILPTAPLPSAATRGLHRVLRGIRAPAAESDMWKLGSATEASVGLGDTAAAIAYAKAFTAHGCVTAFAAHSLLRQLQQVWGLTEDREPGTTLIPLLHATRFWKGDAFEVPSHAPEHRLRLQRKFGDEYEPINWMRDALERSTCVARLGRRRYQGEATGFFIDGGSIRSDWKDRPLLITNAHAVSDDDNVQAEFGAMASDELILTFTSLDEKRQIRARKCIASFHPDDLDITVLELDPEVKELKLAGPPIGPDPTTGKRINIIGHPHGGSMAFSIRNNEVKRIDAPRFHYLAPTQSGSSGSPIFDQSWQLVGVHHGALPDANEGMMFSQVIDALKRVSST